ncbi:MAG: hypothetical protein OJJ21_09280 [Ferrovibrio sp.]|uniref:hypothetical protein n=1 Tax=Ferrovibrio sp. TaxID=1917215 RepID=UPI00262979CF|nr:hypothetical protein [Ferrovibrio sp.]MCW0233776.1 hypothetical protein [Ferrovibrio sp.]
MADVPADYFAELWAALDADHGLLSSSPSADRINLIAAAKTALGSAGITSDLRKWVGTNKDRFIFAAIAIDNWYEPIGRCKGNRVGLPLHMSEVFDDYIATSRLNGPGGARVILRRPFWGSWADSAVDIPLPGELSAYFVSLMSLPDEIASTCPDDSTAPSSVRLKFRIGRSADSKAIGGATWKVGIAPLAQLSGDIKFERNLDGTLASYDAQVADFSNRIQEVIDTLCRAGCHIIAFPEMAVHENTFASLGAIIRKFGADSNLSLVLAGTTRTTNGSGKPYNRCTIFNHRGDIVLQQNKLTRWNLDASLCSRFGFDPGGDGMYYEHITVGSEVHIVEERDIGRFAALICEDLSRTQPGQWLRNNMLLDLQFTPVLDADLHHDKWEANFGGKAVLAGGCRVIVTNSMPLTYCQNETNRKNKAMKYVVTDSGIGLAVDRVGDKVRVKVLRAPLGSAGHEAQYFDWEPTKWQDLA